MGLKEIFSPRARREASLRKFAHVLLETSVRIERKEPNPLVPAQRFVDGETDPEIIRTAIDALRQIFSKTTRAVNNARKFEAEGARRALVSLADSADIAIEELLFSLDSERVGSADDATEELAHHRCREKVAEEIKKMRAAMWEAIEEILLK